jgi:DDE superfamily endonuclease
MHIVKAACELPISRGTPLSQWDCVELARRLEADGVVAQISRESVRRLLRSHHLKPSRHHAWLSPHVPRDAAYASAVREVCALYTRPLAADERVLCLDEKTSLQPRPRTAPTLPAQPGLPLRVEQEYRRRGALNLFAAFDTRTGKVIGWTARRKRAIECIAFLELIDRQIPAEVTTIHIVLDNLRVHTSKAVTAWLTDHPRFCFHFPPVHCSWMNQVEQWFSILARKLLRVVDFPSLDALALRIHNFIDHWNAFAHPFNWTSRSITKIMAKCQLDPSLPHAA